MSAYFRRTTELTKPIASRLEELDIELTERCNNDCIHCCINRPANDAEARASEMTSEQVKDILQQAADLGCLQVRFTGGEPLLRADFEELYVFARRLGMKVMLFTNARLVTPHLADLFAAIPPRVAIEITVYGMRRESYEAVTRMPGSFAQFRRGMNLLLERNVSVVVKSALLPPNKHEMEEFEAWAQTLPGMTTPPYAMCFDLRSRRDDAEKNARIESLRLSPQATLAVLARDEAGYRHEMAEFASRFMGPPGDRLFGCGAGSSICVDAYGRAQPCLALRAPELTVGLISGSDPLSAPEKDGKTRLSDALDTFSHLHERQSTDPDYLRRCAVCFLKGLCEQCPARSWAEHGTLDTPVKYRCELAHAQARYLGWLGEEEHGWEVAAWRERVQGREVIQEERRGQNGKAGMAETGTDCVGA
jgi:radical SAM protein with 4Fe4S-binding SPASM domain